MTRDQHRLDQQSPDLADYSGAVREHYYYRATITLSFEGPDTEAMRSFIGRMKKRDGRWRLR